MAIGKGCKFSKLVRARQPTRPQLIECGGGPFQANPKKQACVLLRDRGGYQPITPSSCVACAQHDWWPRNRPRTTRFFLPTGHPKPPGSGSGKPDRFTGNRPVTGRIWIWIQMPLQFGLAPVYRPVWGGNRPVWAVYRSKPFSFFAWIKRNFGTSFA
jgi:hypothetical protein